MSVLGHGVGSRGDLPLPLWQFVWASAFALIASFFALGVLWKDPRLSRWAAMGRRLPDAARGVAGIALGLLGSALFVVVTVAALFGSADPDTNIAPVAIYVVLWVGVPTAAAVFGNGWELASPFRWLAGAEAPERSGPGAWAAPVLAFAFLVLELTHPSGDAPRVLGWAIVVYCVAVLGGMLRWGRGWIYRGEMFGALFHVFGAMAPIGRSKDRVLQMRRPLSGLAELEVTRATTALILVVLGGTSFDGFAESELGRDFFDIDGRWTAMLILGLGLLASIALVAGLFLAATWFSAEATRTPWSESVRDFTPSLVPIAFGYVVAHYAQLFVDEIQTFVFQLSDPFGQGWNLFGGADGKINFTVISVDLIAWIQVLGIILGHIAAVIVAHDRAIERYDKAKATRSQYAMLYVMVLYSVGGLWLLLNA